MRDAAFQDWRREHEAVEQEMDRLIAAGVPASLEERRVYRTRFAALIERREAAARNLLQSDRRRDKTPSRPGDYLISAAHAGAVPEGQQAAFVSLPDGRQQPKPQSGLPADADAVPAADAAGPSDAAASPPDADASAADPAPPPADTVVPPAASSDDLASDAVRLAPESIAEP